MGKAGAGGAPGQSPAGEQRAVQGWSWAVAPSCWWAVSACSTAARGQAVHSSSAEISIVHLLLKHCLTVSSK